MPGRSGGLSFPAAVRRVAEALGRSLVMLAAWVLAAGAVSARAEGQGGLSVRGRVVRQTLDGVRVVPREPVTLHRVNAKAAGPVDSTVTTANGSFAFRVVAPDSQSMYLASARYGGIEYFSTPVQPGEPASAPSEIVVYDTTSAEVRLQLQGRHLVVSAPNADGVRSVIDVLEISNDTVLTRVAGAANRPTFSLLLPDGARDVRASQGDAGGGAVEVRSGRADLFSPLSPGLRQLVLTYELPAAAFPVSIPLERPVSVLEVLLEEKGASAQGGGLVSQGGVTVDGKVFERYLGQDAPAAAVVTLRAAGGIAGTSLPSWALPVALGAFTLGVILLVSRRSPASDAAPALAAPGTVGRGGAIRRRGPLAPEVAAARRPVPSSRAPVEATTRLARQLAAVDALLAQEPALPQAACDDLANYRSSLKAELVTVLAHRTEVR